MHQAVTPPTALPTALSRESEPADVKARTSRSGRNATAFSPTDTLPVRTWAKMITMDPRAPVFSLYVRLEVGANGVEQARTSGIMRFSQPHDHGGSPCLPTHHPRSSRA